jgi:hypothetical protein
MMAANSAQAETGRLLETLGLQAEILYLVSVGLREADVSPLTRQCVSSWLALQLAESARALIGLDETVVDRLIALPGGREEPGRGRQQRR